eukprot:6323681-Alexandrium_andersonii.AAC.1
MTTTVQAKGGAKGPSTQEGVLGIGPRASVGASESLVGLVARDSPPLLSPGARHAGQHRGGVRRNGGSEGVEPLKVSGTDRRQDAGLGS